MEEPDPTRVRYETSALLTIDVQNDFTLPGAPLEIAGTLEALPAMQRTVSAFRNAGRPIVHVVRLYLPDGSNADLPRRRRVAAADSVVRPGTPGAELVDELKPDEATELDSELLLTGALQQIGDREWLLYKPRWGAFYGTALEEHLRGLEVDSVVVCGCNFPNCPRTTIYEASERDLRIGLVTDAISGLYPRGRRELRNIGVELLDAGPCERRLAGVARPGPHGEA